MKILAIDDDPVAQLVLESALKSLGHEVVLAADGEAAWTVLAMICYRRLLAVFTTDRHAINLATLLGIMATPVWFSPSSRPESSSPARSAARGCESAGTGNLRIGQEYRNLRAKDKRCLP